MLFELTSAFSPLGRYDVCIIGAGAAGISLAMKMAQTGHSVLLAEAGGVEYSDLSQSIYGGDVVGDPYYDLDATRLRYLGGSTNHWAGVCRPLDRRDFQAKAYVTYTTWPIEPDDLVPYLDEAREILGLEAIRDDVPLPQTRDLQQMFWRYAGRLRLGEHYLDQIKNSPEISLLLNANLVGFEIQDQRLAAAHFLNYQKDQVTIDARAFIVACGGIENCRILLIENRKWMR